MNFSLHIHRKQRKFLAIFAVAIAAGIALSIFWGQDWSLPPPMAGGATTVINRTSRGFEQPAPNLSATELQDHLEGDRAFEAVFVTPPAPVNAGLGPLFNNASCAGCHIRDGRGMPVKGQMLVRVSLPFGHSTPHEEQETIFESHPEASVTLGNAPPVPGIGTQIQDQAIYGHQPEAEVEISWQMSSGQYADGTTYELRSPVAQITLANGNPLPPEVLTSLRIPTPVFGRGLLEAIADETILALADPEDSNKDGISGRPNMVWDTTAQKVVLGRFGHKANIPNLLQQAASAYVNDMGVTNPLFPEKDGSGDIDDRTLKTATFYTQTLAVPARTMVEDPTVKRGEKLFQQANCAACHVAELRTANHAIPALAHQTIHPYSDLLLHDMGPELADRRPDFMATGTEWRTPPLWGLGLTQTVLPYSGYLHDGRARTLAEAILWHGGEAAQARENFKKMPQSDRDALVRFLNSL
ncbi:di-heme oxidoredictase family protein [Chroococcidiopsis sp. TS-821]|uniref:di-heme oxidoreductase family protein n=1 Tax=Chroococcidiopsis sp. TS-821 TaxID=1378066 RepID=UPI000CED944C|nr:di-heme oxidoredictase family protein [Chroococcidiopsis sp. TS-821]PPS44809.1 thiol oxidoreductase [Chroococcidiopsis sp. TS-821]